MPSLHVFTKKYCYCHANLDSKSHLVSHYVFLSKVRATLGRGSCCSRSQIANAFLYAFLCLLLCYGSYSSQFVELCILQMWSCCGTKYRICAVSSVWLFSFYLSVLMCPISRRTGASLLWCHSQKCQLQICYQICSYVWQLLTSKDLHLIAFLDDLKQLCCTMQGVL